ncbi:hypothetical protein [Microvirga pudoricolor]|uniref:hypothetical protein n=1 Tax=Microvirga pudoricolor TaxID=2778729 RepID=UPI001951F5D7|nr:hypothetical protein [Microvirga pudoricolor]MBM6596765.1 hypothetical protein [Microvirga pudoricolor]
MAETSSTDAPETLTGTEGADQTVTQAAVVEDTTEAERRLKTVETVVAADARQWDTSEHDYRGFAQQALFYATSQGGLGGDGGRGGDGEKSVNAANYGNGSHGGNGGDGGDAAAFLLETSILTLDGRDKISLFATSAGGDGGSGGNGGNGGFAWKSIDSGNGGDGGNGGNGGAAWSLVDDVLVTAGGGNDRISIFSTAMGGAAGDGGFGGHNGNVKGSINSGNGGDGGDGGSGGDATSRLSDTTVYAGTGHDQISLAVTAYGASSGKGGSYGKGGSSKYGSHSGAAGSGGDGGDARAEMVNVKVFAEQGDDSIRISLSASVGSQGKGAANLKAFASITLVNSTFDGGEGNDSFALVSKTNKGSAVFNVSGNIFDGGVGIDKIDFKSWSKAISIEFGTERLDLGSGFTNTIRNFETVVGTSSADRFAFSQYAAGLKVTGGSGGDSFLLSVQASDAGWGTITDFSGKKKGGDKFVIDDAAFSNLAVGSPIKIVEASDITQASSSGNKGYFIYDKSGADAGGLFYDPTGGNGSDAYDVVMLAGKPHLSASDFYIV